MKHFDLDPDRGLPPETCRLIYISEMTISGKRSQVASAIRNILRASREFNRGAGITGALLLDLKRFTQVLEGPPHAVKSLYGHIVCDSRHKNVSLVEFLQVPKREFPTWSMAYVAPPRKASPQFPSGQEGLIKSEGELIVELMRHLLTQNAGGSPLEMAGAPRK